MQKHAFCLTSLFFSCSELFQREIQLNSQGLLHFGRKALKITTYFIFLWILPLFYVMKVNGKGTLLELVPCSHFPATGERSLNIPSLLCHVKFLMDIRHNSGVYIECYLMLHFRITIHFFCYNHISQLDWDSMASVIRMKCTSEQNDKKFWCLTLWYNICMQEWTSTYWACLQFKCTAGQLFHRMIAQFNYLFQVPSLWKKPVLLSSKKPLSEWANRSRHSLLHCVQDMKPELRGSTWWIITSSGFVIWAS